MSSPSQEPPAKKQKMSPQKEPPASSRHVPNSQLSQNNGESSSGRAPQPSTSHASGAGLGPGLGLGLNDSFSNATVKDEDSDDSFEEDPSKKEEAKSLTAAQIAENFRRVSAAVAGRNSISAASLSAFGISINERNPGHWQDTPGYEPGSQPGNFRRSDSQPRMQKIAARVVKEKLDFFGSLASLPELLMELALHLRMADLLNLYCISKDFNETINGHMSHCMLSCARYQSPESSEIFLPKFYNLLLIPDPASRPQPNSNVPEEVRNVPSLKWLAMVNHRERSVRDILACMARQGFRMRPGMSNTLKKMWLIMDVSTTAGRVQLVHDNRFFTDYDLYLVQFFVVKLDMRFNDPIDGEGSEDMRKLFLGQRSLTPLAQLLKRQRFLERMEMVQFAIRYSYKGLPEHYGYPIFGVPPEEIGVGHLEGWGRGRVHLMRPDELVMVESVRRNLDFKSHLLEMMTWGYVDPITGANIPVTEEEKYMSEEEDVKIAKANESKGWSDYVKLDKNTGLNAGSDGEEDEESEEEYGFPFESGSEPEDSGDDDADIGDDEMGEDEESEGNDDDEMGEYDSDGESDDGEDDLDPPFM